MILWWSMYRYNRHSWNFLDPLKDIHSWLSSVKTHRLLSIWLPWPSQWLPSNLFLCSGDLGSLPVALFPGTVHRVHRHTRKSWCRRRSKLFTVSHSQLVDSYIVTITVININYSYFKRYMLLWVNNDLCFKRYEIEWNVYMQAYMVAEPQSQLRLLLRVSEALGLKPKKLLLAKKQMNEESYDFRHFTRLNLMTVPTSWINDTQEIRHSASASKF